MRNLAYALCLLLIAVTAGCGDDEAPGGADAALADADPNAPDADPNAPDADPNAPDADPNGSDADPGEVGVSCGEMTCEVGQDCCLGGGGSATCVEPGTCQGTTVSCDGPGQCLEEGEVCCASIGGGGTTCVESTNCQTVVCQEATDCPNQGQQCCMIGNIGFCQNQCPGGGN